MLLRLTALVLALACAALAVPAVGRAQHAVEAGAGPGRVLAEAAGAVAAIAAAAALGTWLLAA